MPATDREREGAFGESSSESLSEEAFEESAVSNLNERRSAGSTSEQLPTISSETFSLRRV